MLHGGIELFHGGIELFHGGIELFRGGPLLACVLKARGPGLISRLNGTTAKSTLNCTRAGCMAPGPWPLARAASGCYGLAVPLRSRTAMADRNASGLRQDRSSPLRQPPHPYPIAADPDGSRRSRTAMATAKSQLWAFKIFPPMARTPLAMGCRRVPSQHGRYPMR